MLILVLPYKPVFLAILSFSTVENPSTELSFVHVKIKFCGSVRLSGCCFHGIQLPYHYAQRLPDYLDMSADCLQCLIRARGIKYCYSFLVNIIIALWHKAIVDSAFCKNVLKCVAMMRNNNYQITQSSYFYYFF